MRDVTPHRPRLVFTDLDGSLLDHYSYDWKPAETWLRRLAEASIAVIPVTSKTRAELIELRRELGLEDAPFIAENGAVVGLPSAWQHARLDRDPRAIDGLRIKALGVDVHFLRQRLGVMRRRLNLQFRCLSEMAIDEVMLLTGLEKDAASRALEREGSEPLLWEDDDEALSRFLKALRNDELTLTQGGRFWHVMGNVDKGRAVNWLTARFAALRGQTPVTLGLGDGPNDVSLLQAVDQAVLIRGVHPHPVDLAGDALYRTRETGPRGWVEGMDYWLGEELA